MTKGEPKLSVRERLLDVADVLFYEEGVHTVGIDRILAEAGVAKASLYSTFGSKDELVREYLRRRDERMRTRILKRVEATDEPAEKLLAVFDGLSGRVSEGGYHGCPFIRASAEGAPGVNTAREVSKGHRAWMRSLFEELARGAEAKSPATLASQLSFLYDGATTAVAMEGDDKAPVVALAAASQLVMAAIAEKAKGAKRKTAR